jgi:hypothetical protein
MVSIYVEGLAYQGGHTARLRRSVLGTRGGPRSTDCR